MPNEIAPETTISAMIQPGERCIQAAKAEDEEFGMFPLSRIRAR